MEDFKANPKMQCFKEGGQVKYESRKEHAEEVKADVNQDKKIVKKAFKIHDTQSHEGKKTDLSKLNKGGRAKKAKGSVKKFEKASGQYGAKKTDGDIKNIKDAKNFKPVKLCGGKGVKKYEGGGSVFDTIKSGATKLKENLLGTEEQNKIAQENLNKQATQGSKLAKFLGGKNLAGQGAITEAEREAMRSSETFNKKNGGEVKNMNAGGSLKEVDAEENPGLSKLPPVVRNKMGYMRKGGKAC
jgi:hypothetical protein